MAVSASNVPDYFGTAGEKASVNIDWYDINTGIGYKDLYPAKLYTSGAESYIILTEEVASSSPYTEHNNAVLNIIYDFPISSTMKIKGDFYIQSPMWFENADGAATWTRAAYVYRLFKLSGGTETQIGFNISGATGNLGPTNNAYNMIGGYSNTNGHVVLKAGDTLRLRLSGAATGDTDFHTYHYHDPSNATGRDAAILTRKFILSIPIVMGL
jgi:hypothetical protein